MLATHPFELAVRTEAFRLCSDFHSNFTPSFVNFGLPSSPRTEAVRPHTIGDRDAESPIGIGIRAFASVGSPLARPRLRLSRTAQEAGGACAGRGRSKGREGRKGRQAWRQANGGA